MRSAARSSARPAPQRWWRGCTKKQLTLQPKRTAPFGSNGRCSCTLPMTALQPWHVGGAVHRATSSVRRVSAAAARKYAASAGPACGSTQPKPLPAAMPAFAASMRPVRMAHPSSSNSPAPHATTSTMGQCRVERAVRCRNLRFWPSLRRATDKGGYLNMLALFCRA